MADKASLAGRTGGVEEARRAFDEAYYRAAYPDVAGARIDPFEHFMATGWREGRDPSRRFDTAFYVRDNPDVAEAGVNPLVHYLASGRHEGRQPLPPHLRRRPANLAAMAAGSPAWPDLAADAAPSPLGGETTIRHTVEGHLVLAGPDVRLPPDWPARLLQPILDDPQGIASVTAFSNAAAFTAYALPEGCGSAEEVDRAFARLPPIAAEIPGGDDFCIAVSRAAIEAAGPFEAAAGGDWFHRASLAGLRHLAGNIYVGRPVELETARRPPAARVRGHDLTSWIFWREDPLAETRFLVSALVWRARATSAVLLVDHDLGGGSNVYTAQLTDDLLAAGACVARLAVGEGRARITVHFGDGRIEAEEAWRPDLLKLAGLLLVDEVVVAGVHGAEDIEGMLGDLAAVAAGRRLVVALADFLPVCPSLHLMDAEGRHCAVPDLDVCHACLPANWHARFATKGVPRWRRAWARLLGQADEVRTFSEASRALIRRAFPGLEPAKLTVAQTGYSAKLSPVAWTPPQGSPRIGVIGDVGPLHKGSGVVLELARRLALDGAGVTVFGAWEAETPENIKVCGRYEVADLPRLIAREGVGAILFPSICPETYSFVLSEVFAMELPVACLDLGAQAERVGAYRYGAVAPDADPQTLLASLDKAVAAKRKDWTATSAV